MTLLVVRHAHAGNRQEWNGIDVDRPLSRRGMVQAFGVADLLAEWHPSTIASSPALRCRQTVEPLSGRLGVPVEVDDRLFEGASTDETMELVRELAGSVAVVSTHGDVIPALLERLATSDGLELADDAVWAKASTWVLDRAGERLRTGRYLPPPDRLAESASPVS